MGPLLGAGIMAGSQLLGGLLGGGEDEDKDLARANFANQLLRQKATSPLRQKAIAMLMARMGHRAPGQYVGDAVAAPDPVNYSYLLKKGKMQDADATTVRRPPLMADLFGRMNG